ncbi:AgmX/PglI C-terminal domain-containing protein [Ideonella sp. BN130291]|uniref:AgmX/PglI C-terminal domain-containing protein n=1 Tax=Ideonella sp. BN130291 TaxID=3112940 RepID=UPI002E2539B9|nr:AgmX/PglI C-terminal domain-containing protein [Ideonella sp. BN130291]
MSATLAVSFRAPVLPWSVSSDDEVRFKRIVQRVLLVSLLLAIALPWLPVMKEDRARPQELPPRLTKLVLEREAPPPPPPPVVKAERTKEPPVPAPTAKAEAAKPSKPVKAEPTMKHAVAPEARNPQPNKPPGEVLDGIRRKAAGVGLLAMSNELAELRGAPVAVQLNQDIKPGKGVGSGVGVGVGAGKEPGLPDRSLITSNATGGSGGINTAGYSRDTGGGGLAGRATTLVAGVAGGGGGGGAGAGGVRGGKGDGNGMGVGSGGGKGGTLQAGGGGKPSRSIEEIRLVFERNKGAIYAIYNRALREDPSLQGKVVLKLTIAPAGNVVDCRIESSDLHAAELEGKLLARIRQFDFGAKDVNQIVITYPVDFLPS